MYDIVVIGSGVAGLSAAIAGSASGLRVLVLERSTTPPSSPGETFHPGIEPLLSHFGVLEAVDRAATGRPGGIIVEDGRRSKVQSYGSSHDAQWFGYHVPRKELHQILFYRALALGATVRFGCSARSVIRINANKLLVQTETGSHSCSWLFDGTGPANWLARIDRTGYQDGSPQFTVSYGYRQLPREKLEGLPWPCISLRSWGWTWDAPLGDGRVAWVHLYNNRDAMLKRRPAESRSADATWRVSRVPAHCNMFRIGDAALRVDPSSGKGVLRAMMSAIMAVHLVKSVRHELIDHRSAELVYCKWISDWFSSDVRELSGLLNGLRDK